MPLEIEPTAPTGICLIFVLQKNSLGGFRGLHPARVFCFTVLCLSHGVCPMTRMRRHTKKSKNQYELFDDICGFDDESCLHTSRFAIFFAQSIESDSWFVYLIFLKGEYFGDLKCLKTNFFHGVVQIHITKCMCACLAIHCLSIPIRA